MTYLSPPAFAILITAPLTIVMLVEWGATQTSARAPRIARLVPPLACGLAWLDAIRYLGSFMAYLHVRWACAAFGVSLGLLLCLYGPGLVRHGGGHFRPIHWKWILWVVLRLTLVGFAGVVGVIAWSPVLLMSPLFLLHQMDPDWEDKRTRLLELSVLASALPAVGLLVTAYTQSMAPATPIHDLGLAIPEGLDWSSSPRLMVAMGVLLLASAELLFLRRLSSLLILISPVVLHWTLALVFWHPLDRPARQLDESWFVDGEFRGYEYLEPSCQWLWDGELRPLVVESCSADYVPTLLIPVDTELRLHPDTTVAQLSEIPQAFEYAHIGFYPRPLRPTPSVGLTVDCEGLISQKGGTWFMNGQETTRDAIKTEFFAVPWVCLSASPTTRMVELLPQVDALARRGIFVRPVASTPFGQEAPKGVRIE